MQSMVSVTGGEKNPAITKEQVIDFIRPEEGTAANAKRFAAERCFAIQQIQQHSGSGATVILYTYNGICFCKERIAAKDSAASR